MRHQKTSIRRGLFLFKELAELSIYTHRHQDPEISADLLDRMATARVFVVGDLILDAYIEGTVQRISPEAPVPVVLQTRNRAVLGGAGNVAANIQAFGARVELCGRLGRDADGHIYRELCRERGLDLHPIESVDLPTTRKTRVLAGYQQLLRIDQESTEEISQTQADFIFQALAHFCQQTGPRSCVISDYAKGMLPGFVTRTVIEECRRASIPVVTDPKSPELSRYAGTTVLKPDLKEGSAALRRLHPATSFTDFEQEVAAIGESLLQLSGAQNIALSLSERGLLVMGVQLAQPTRLLTRAVRVADVSGAGDTMVAFLALGLAAQIDLVTTAEISNLAAGLVCAKLGTATCSRSELLEALLGPELG